MTEEDSRDTAREPGGENVKQRFPVVGIGASAGGLAATSEVLKHLGRTPGVAVVVVHHLDPHHDSSLVEILSRVGEMPVEAVRDGLPVEVNHVYVISPNVEVTIADRTLRLAPRGDTNIVHLPVDAFLESLARDQDGAAVGVILAGTGSDGADGVRALKVEGGVSFAQDSSAEHHGMPNAAVATGCVDFVLPPPLIAKELLRLGARPTPAESPTPDASDASFRRIFDHVRKTTGVDLGGYKFTTINRRIQRRLRVHGIASIEQYAEFLERTASEARALCEEILIHVTSFFRDPEVFASLTESVFPRLVEKRASDACIRVWVPGCSTGEEVYSLAMALLEFLANRHREEIPVKLFGTDVSSQSIDRARSGRYPLRIESEVSAGRLARFFVKADGGYQIRRDVRDLCVFAKQDATRDPPFSSMDLVSCRNLMIYLAPALQERLLPILHYSLKEPGFLVLGTAETTRAFPGFTPLDSKNKIYSRTSAAPRLLFDFASPPLTPASPEPPPPRLSGASDIYREADRLVLAAFAPPGVVITDDLAIVQFRGNTGPFLAPLPGVASFDLLRMVREELRLPLRQTIEEARSKRTATARVELLQTPESSAYPVELEVIHFAVPTSTQRFFLVLFRPVTSASGNDQGGVTIEGGPRPPVEAHNHEAKTGQELASTRDYLHSVIQQLETTNEELKGANEEVVSSNEELRSTNEELQVAKEELQATNEELLTVNEELAQRNAEGVRLSDDLTNVLNSIEVPIVMLDRASRLRRMTPAATRVLRLLPGDVGHPVLELTPIHHAPDIAEMTADVLARLTPLSRVVQDAEGRWCQLTVRPYVTADARVDGTVISLFDIDAAKRAEERLREARDYAEGIVDTLRESLVVLSEDLHVRSTNRTFRRSFLGKEEQVDGRLFYEIAGGAWNVQDLRQKLEHLGQEATLEAFRVEHDTSHGGPRVLLLNARWVEQSRLILLAIEDVTEQERAAQAAKQTELAFRQMLQGAAPAVLMVNDTGRIVFANTSAERMFGFAEGELTGRPVESIVPERFRGGHAEKRRAYLIDPSARSMEGGLEVVALRKDGSEFPADVSVSRIERDGTTTAVVFIADITRRRASEAKVLEYQKQLQGMVVDHAVSEERARRIIAKGLHERLGQSLAVAQIRLASVRDQATGEPREGVDAALELVQSAIRDVRTLTFELSPPILYDFGLEEALAWLAEDLERRLGLHVELSNDAADKPLPEPTAALLFRAVRALLDNVFKHAKVKVATVSLRRTDRHIEITVEDKGSGFDTTTLGTRAGPGGFGLLSLREQITSLGGVVEVTSAPGNGTRVRMSVPLQTIGPMGEAPKEQS